MKTLIVLFIFCSSLFSFGQSLESELSNPVELENQISHVLEKLIPNYDVFSLHINSLQASQGVESLSPTLKLLYRDLKIIPEFADNLSKSVLNNQHNLTTLVHYNFRLTGNMAGGFGPPLAGMPPSEYYINSSEKLTQSIQKLVIEIDFNFPSAQDKQGWEILPFEFQGALIKFLLACYETEYLVDQFIAPIKNAIPDLGSKNPTEIFKFLMLPWQNRQLKNFDLINCLNDIDLAKLSIASRILNDNLRSLIRINSLVDNKFERCTIYTKYGDIGIFGNKNDTLTTDYFISIDFGGDEYYLNNCGSNTPGKNHVGLLLDYSGNDTYNSDSGFINSGILGCSILIDIKGDDKFYNSMPGLAFALFGSSILTDFKGNDRYESTTNYSQGAAIAGVSISLDYSGNDKYFCRNNSQGYASTLGCGTFIDIKGDDFYKGGSPNEPDICSYGSFIQGASKGRWAEATDGHSLAGGFGIFIDGQGKDEYFANSFSQGAGYYFGIGMFNDLGGDDIYNALSHSQGYAAHFALGNFCEYSGNDRYNSESDLSKITQILGGGRDNSCGIFSDLLGDDTYYSGNRCLGIGDMRGTGIFYDPSGTNLVFWSYNKQNSNIPSFGKAVATKSSINEFRLFNMKRNWNSGIVLLKGFKQNTENMNFPSVKIHFEEKVEFNIKQKTIQITKSNF